MSSITNQESVRTPQSPDSPTPPLASVAARDAWNSEELLGRRSEVQILHNGEVYRLRLTRQGKLILYK